MEVVIDNLFVKYIYLLIAEHCKEKLDEYVKTHFTNVRVVRAKQREGLIRTRLLGAKAAKGDVLIFLDSHVEATTNWLPPLLGKVTGAALYWETL